MQRTFPVASRTPPTSAAPFVPETRDVHALAIAAAGCRGCELYARATQTVFGEGPNGARVVLVGEQPGDSEDRIGRPFVGPAGALLDLALEAAGIPRADVYVTNAVKHFKWKLAPRGKKRLHAKPSRSEVQACRPWLDAELAAIRPAVLVLLGATAAQALLGAKFSVLAMRGRVLATPLARATIATVHPASVLRAPDEDARRAARAQFFADLAVAGDCYRAAERHEACRAIAPKGE